MFDKYIEIHEELKLMRVIQINKLLANEKS
jgi:hypothetical protein